MAVRVALTHRTTYEYERPAQMGPQVIRLRPAPHNRTPIHSYSLKIQPPEHFLNWQQDPHGNFLARIVVPEKTKRFEVLVDMVADLEAYNPFDFFLEPGAENYPFEYSPEQRHELTTYLEKSELTPALARFLEGVDKTSRRTVDFLVDLNQKISNAVDYVIRMEPGVQTPEETLGIGSGSCRDSAWLLVQAARQLGVAARFVSGYLIQLTPDQRPLDGPPGPERDFTDLHAWAEVYVPGGGWIGLDPTSGLFAAEGHIPVACAPTPTTAAPVEGAVEKVDGTFDFEMHVQRIVDVPRVTKPYTDDQWEAILTLGDRVDASLDAQDVRLTMGGEPTFVASKNPDAAEWNTEAMGPDKLGIADRLARKLRQLWAPGGLFHHGQGKWYPGEQLPRWALSVVSRVDGQPIWSRAEFFALSEQPPGHTEKDAERFVRTLIEVLAIDDRGLLPAYEDAWYYMWRERRLPVNVDPLASKLSDKVERDRLTRVFRQGLNKTVGWVLPLGHDGFDFVTGKWFLREENCFLVPGDSPMGFRLPLDSVPWTADVDYDGPIALDPTVERPALPSFDEVRARRQSVARTPVRLQTPGAPYPGQEGPEKTRVGSRPSAAKVALGEGTAPLLGISALGIVKTALCVEPRDGILKIFLPPMATAESFIELIAAIERTCELTGLPVQLEGYPAPDDPRLRVFKLTPDPGVLEVNVPPVSGFRNLVEQTEQLYEAARHEGLAAEKFDLDGKHIGSGGGNHLVFGAQTPLESPFLRRPDLLRSLISFWHNHPSLSYLFSGQFIGPTSQSPRVDEARNDAVYELELAFAQLPHGREVPPWLVDRILRHLLTDVTGNTHRTEFCIDKLYSPDSATGRLGLLEMRAFEMPPHHRMASAQHVLVRALLALFHEKPYQERLVKWGTSLHDKFLLPHFIKHDLVDALSYIRARGFDLDPTWFEPHYQFRFPYYGQFVKDDVLVEVRGALEPWHVLGEESSGGGQSRYVDSSLERIQIKARGLTPDRHLICVNGVVLPLHRTDVVSEGVAGVRYRAWQPPSCLHPTIGIDGPLRIELYDSWNRRAIAGSLYHVVHPGGRAAEDRPVNAVAAESRRIARFQHLGHTPTCYEPRRAGVNADFPMTLDLRLLRP